jgi:hypothetical protein
MDAAKNIHQNPKLGITETQSAAIIPKEPENSAFT